MAEALSITGPGPDLLPGADGGALNREIHALAREALDYALTAAA